MPGLSVFRDHRGKVVVRSLHLSGLSLKRQVRHPRALSELAGNISSLLQKMIAADGSGGELLVHSLFQGGSKGAVRKQHRAVYNQRMIARVSAVADLGGAAPAAGYPSAASQPTHGWAALAVAAGRPTRMRPFPAL
jgi:hypothetical protein